MLGLLALVGLSAFAQDVVVEYLEGVLERSVGASWKALDIGDKLPPEATIRLSGHGLIELAQGKLRITISQDGVYRLSDAFAKSKQVAGWDLKNVVASKVKTAVAGSGRGEVAVMGTRGAAAGQPAEVTWVEAGETAEIVAKGRQFLEAGQYAEALKVFEKGYENAFAEEEQVFLYYIALTHVQSGKGGRALATLRGVDPDPRTSVFSDLVLLEGQLLVDSLAFQDALTLFNRQLAQQQTGAFAQAMWIMSAYCYRGLGDAAKVRETLTRARDLDPKSPLGQEAASMLQGL